MGSVLGVFMENNPNEIELSELEGVLPPVKWRCNGCYKPAVSRGSRLPPSWNRVTLKAGESILCPACAKVIRDAQRLILRIEAYMSHRDH
jgi:hypothetical protein